MEGLTLDDIRQIEMMQQSQPQPQYNPNIPQYQSQMVQPQMQQQYQPPQIMQQPMHQEIPVYNEPDLEPVRREIDPELLGSSKKKSKKKQKKTMQENKTITQILYAELKDPVIILIFYLILSHPMIFNLFASQIKHLRPNERGELPITGYVVYGLILSGLFYITKKFT